MPGCLGFVLFLIALDKSFCDPKGKDDLHDRHDTDGPMFQLDIRRIFVSVLPSP